ncbi:hypothetical protein WN55_04660, partial [Dufourea novaeangliae]
TSISQLTSDVIMLKAKLLEMQKMKNSREENYREVIQQYHSTVVKQCSALKDELDEVRVMNESFDNRVVTIDVKLAEIIHGKEEKLQATLIEQYRNMKEEFSKLKSDVDYEIQQQNENLMSKVSELNKTVLKLEKSKQKLGYDYEKKMLHIIQV